MGNAKANEMPRSNVTANETPRNDRSTMELSLGELSTVNGSLVEGNKGRMNHKALPTTLSFLRGLKDDSIAAFELLSWGTSRADPRCRSY